MKQTVKLILKISFAGIIIYYLLRSGKLDFGLISTSLKNGYHWLYCFILLFLVDIIAAIRWRYLLHTGSSVTLPLKSIIKVNWIGLFFNSFLPGAVTGDFIKLVYAKDLDPNLRKTFLIMSVLMDRILGLIGLLLLLGVSSAIYYTEITSVSSEMNKLIHFNLFLFLGSVVFLITLFLPSSIQEIIKSIVIKIPLLGNKISITLSQVWIMGESKITILKVLGISLLTHFLSLTAFFLISSPFYNVEIPLQYVFAFIPIGFMATAIPISPAGLGVGHAIFEKLFEFMGTSGGANFFNLYFICLVIVNSLGIFPYLFGKKHSLKETKEFEETQSTSI